MNQCVPSWDLEDINRNQNVFKLDYEVAELTWEKWAAGHARPRAAETLEAIVDQAKLQPYSKYQVAVNDEEVVPWLQHRIPTVATGSVNASGTMTSDALVPSSNGNSTASQRVAQAHQSIKSAHDTGCSTRVGSCSGAQSAFLDRRMGQGGGSTTVAAHEWSSCRDQSVSIGSETFAATDTYDGDLGGSRLTSTTGSPQNTSSGKDYSRSTSPDDSLFHCRPHQPEANGGREKRKVKAKPSISNRRRRTAAIHNQSERKRRDKINQRMNTLQKLVPNSSKTDKASMLDEVREYVKQLQAHVHMMSKMNMSSMMMPLAMQQQQMQMAMMNSMGMGMGMGMGGMMDMNTICSNFPVGFHPSTFMHMPSWNHHPTDQVTTTAPMAAANPMSAFLACRSQPITMDAYGRMTALYQHMQNQTCGPLPKN
ncbi:unnamed protein product [Lactuca virosa]|uniref:BHLH domain-containing protein n=1 Tax=Lactuca virosa TaxID=75947 RepID=A0AAU9PD54_9ASTR|nr:unnamed protein product [Lactuca virosa]